MLAIIVDLFLVLYSSISCKIKLQISTPVVYLYGSFCKNFTRTTVVTVLSTCMKYFVVGLQLTALFAESLTANNARHVYYTPTQYMTTLLNSGKFSCLWDLLLHYKILKEDCDKKM